MSAGTSAAGKAAVIARALVLSLACLATLAASPAACAGGASARFRRGVAVHSMLNWARLKPGDTGRYADEPFAGAPYELPDALIRGVKAAGFDFVRLTVDPGPFLQLQGPARDALDRKLAGTVRRFLGFGLAVMVDFHPNSHVSAFDPVNWLTATDAPLFGRYVALLGRTARLLAALKTPAVAIELMNEPPYGYDPESVARWQRMAEAMHAAVRAGAPDLLVVLTGAQGGNRHGLAELDPAPFRGSRVLFSFHYYEPYAFTHEGVEAREGSAAMWRYFSAMPYPTDRDPAWLVRETVHANVDADPALDVAERASTWARARAEVDAYLGSHFDRRTIEAAFDGVADWARRHGVNPEQVFLGEFGVTRTYGRYRAAEPASLDAWLHDVRSAAEARGFGWSLWALSGYGGMALVSDDDSADLDPGTLQSLGLTTPGP